jgi:S-DNA-T family DNA segregation ATPase FtsK/SpoIIIE
MPAVKPSPSRLKKAKTLPIKTPPSYEEEPGWIDRAYSFLTHFRRFGWDIAGVFIIVLVLLVLIGMTGLTKGSVLTPLADLMRTWMGWGSLLILLSLLILGLTAIRRENLKEPAQFTWWMICYEVSSFAFMALLACISGFSLDAAEGGKFGGIIGWGLADILKSKLGIFPTVVFWLLLFVLFATGGVRFVKATAGLFQAIPEENTASGNLTPQDEEVPFPPDADYRQEELELPIDELPLEEKKPSQPIVEKQASKPRKILELKPQKKAPPKEEQVEDEPQSALRHSRDTRLPPLNLLIDEQMNKPDERHIHLTAGLLEKSLSDFGIPAKVVGYRVGPTVTQFAVEPGYIEKVNADGEVSRQKIRVSQISTLSRDLALALSAANLRIEAPVPGRSYVGIEVPNSRTSIVRLRPVLESDAAQKMHAPLMLALGRDVSGLPVLADLSRMPHLLIAGTTGSGKSVCIEAITACLALNNSPEDLRLVMIDPKMVELVRFNGLPHLLGKVETDLERILGVLRWTITEMDQRYRLLESAKCRDIDSYNSKMQRKGQAVLPRIVVMIDELADLMMSAPDQTEPCLVRLAQLARATGIHLVVATQRPSTDVITGLIKANFPARISFAVASSIDSRVILDSTGAETLLGHGDMLYLNPESGTPQRAQGVWVHDQEIEKVVTYWQKMYPEMMNQPAPWDEMLEEEAEYGGADTLVKQAVEIVRHSQRASASMLQRKLRIGYPRAARLMDELEDLGVVGPSQGGGKDREVLVSDDSDVDSSDEEGDDEPIDEE